MVCPSSALYSSLSIRTETWGTGCSFLRARDGVRHGFADVAAQAAAGLRMRLLGPQRRHGFVERLRPHRRRQEMRVMARAGAGFGRRLVVLECRKQTFEA